MHERYNNPEQSIPSWEEILLAVIQRKVMPEDDPNRPPVDEITSCMRSFHMPNGNTLTALGLNGPALEWGLTVTPSDSGIDFTVVLEPYRGELRLVPLGSEVPLDPSTAEYLGGQLAASPPLGEAEYLTEKKMEQTIREGRMRGET